MSTAMEFVNPLRLTGCDWERIERVCGESVRSSDARHRFAFYVRKGHCYNDAVRYTLAWARNMVEQRARRLSHDTGAEGWRSPWAEVDVDRLDNYTGNVVR